MTTTVNTLRITFSTSVEGVMHVVSLKFADPSLKETGGKATVQAAAQALITAQPFADITLSSFVKSDFVVRTVTDIDI